MRYIHAMQGAFIALALSTALFFSLPSPLDIPSGATVLTVATFLFAIIAGFYIARLGARYDSMRSLVAEEDANFLVLFQVARVYGKGFESRIGDLIDRYYLTAYDSELASYQYKKTAPAYKAIWDEVAALKRVRTDAACQVLMNLLAEIEKSRNSAVTVAGERLHASEWSVLVVLSSIIVVGLLGLDLTEPLIRAIGVSLSTALVLILLILRDLQNLMLGGTALLEESGQEVFESIGKPRYYNRHFVKRGISRIPDTVTSYRLGRHDPGSDKKDIVLVRSRGGKGMR